MQLHKQVGRYSRLTAAKIPPQPSLDQATPPVNVLTSCTVYYITRWLREMRMLGEEGRRVEGDIGEGGEVSTVSLEVVVVTE